ncbi:cyclopropane-fatty-acyl-phospholipid synthase family protein [Pseudoalteromonas sp. CnMc7-15]|uniref:SAM-dependent methyltransferase n=1 Tax=unclassified Pseudoalteromonas TaxID=194690 RepID=UPI001EF6B385|nr:MULTISPECIES: cyclopropane-fatty-acyl-phospholipid synthase family protein [unclassified Pseudoalteromonas]MCG7565630.1 cyclopropane-fatty-acyl-phospholipid synthase family protein [Pseudoalteromonas sp. CnMc7-15]MCG7569249.1 cyclopropane-fatty-acyl-phospholipid synthase family protein [Pseudoalteromonas sp. CNC9-20]
MDRVTQVEAKKSISWKSQIAKRFVLAAMRTLEHGYVEMHFRGQSYQFGNNTSSLRARVDISDARMFDAFAFGGSIGAAESFIDGHWQCDNLTALVEIFVLNQDQLDEFEGRFAFFSAIAYRLKHLRNRNSTQGSKRNIVAHYDLGNELYESFLSDEMLYSCAVYPQADATLEQAQAHKLKLICERVQLADGDQVVEIGTGWGAFAIYAATHYDVHVTTTTISDQQHAYVQQKIAQHGLEDKITLLKKDYRLLEGHYDKLVSIEMIEAVGHEYLGEFFSKCNSLLKPSGAMLIQAITINDQRYSKYVKETDFIQQYIFPGGCLVCVDEMSKHLRKNTDLVMHELHDIGLHYARTLADWRARFEKAWPQLQGAKFNSAFYRLWLYYLAYCEGAFRQRAISTVHLSARKQGFNGGDDHVALSY